MKEISSQKRQEKGPQYGAYIHFSKTLCKLETYMIYVYVTWTLHCEQHIHKNDAKENL